MPLDFTFTEDQELIRKAVREWCERNMPIEKVREMDNKGEIPREIWKGMAELGILLPTVPKEHGGAGVDWITHCIIGEEIGYADITIATAAAFIVVEGAWGFTLDKYCSEEVREKYVKPAIKGEKFVGIATTEPGGGSDVAAFKTTATRKGNEWIINGEKMYISGTEEAKKYGGGFWITARTSPAPPEAAHRGMTSFFVPMDAPGIEITKRFDDCGRMAISTGGFKMEEVRLPDEYRVGEEGKGFYYTMEGFDNARLIIAASAVGVTRRVLEIGIDYIKQRKAFGWPIGKYEGISFELADLWTEMEATKALVYKTAWMNDMKYKEGKFSAREVAKWISMCKLKAPPLALRACEKVMIWHGAYGYTKECPVEMGWRGVMSYCIGAEGATNIQRVVLVRELLGPEYVAYKKLKSE